MSPTPVKHDDVTGERDLDPANTMCVVGQWLWQEERDLLSIATGGVPVGVLDLDLDLDLGRSV